MLDVAVVRFPGSNSDFDALRSVERAGMRGYFVWHRESDLRGADFVILPGGFSYGDYLRAGAIARFSPVMQAVQRHAAAGGPVLGICNGFQILCESHLLPGALMRNAGLSFVSKPVDLTVERTTTPFTSAFGPGATVRLPVAHGEGRFAAAEETLRMLEAEGRVVLRYVAASEGSPLQPNPNGSAHHIAGVSNAAGNVVGIMPHPERFGDPASPDGGALFFTSMAAWQPQASTSKATR
ncbi:MAG TPA: phosphoribosylformylglycinamidine synthase subunit PurQ [Gemmatimonadales bacterium]|nr:phosphoribosylformylglycinamidine synthase subunit PurQ [Gemmatimonadales bacterium]